MGIFRRRGQKDRRMQDDLLRRLDGKELQYVLRRSVDENGAPTETVLGKGGRFICANGHVSILAGEREVFHNDAPETVSCGELLALNGALVKGYNQLLGSEDTLVAYYSYYRK